MKPINLTLTLTLGQKNTLAQMAVKLKAHYGKVLPIYRQASTEGRGAILSHNPVFAALLDITGGGE